MKQLEDAEVVFAHEDGAAGFGVPAREADFFGLAYVVAVLHHGPVIENLALKALFAYVLLVALIAYQAGAVVRCAVDLVDGNQRVVFW